MKDNHTKVQEGLWSGIKDKTTQWAVKHLTKKYTQGAPDQETALKQALGTMQEECGPGPRRKIRIKIRRKKGSTAEGS